MTAIVSDYGSRLEDVDKMLSRIADRETPLLKRHLDLPNPATAIKHEWVDKPLKGLIDTLASSISSTTQTIITVNGGTNTPKRYIPGLTVLLIAGERMLVNSVITTVTNSATLFIGSSGRGYHSTTAISSAATGTQVKLMNFRTEGFSTGRDDSQKGTRNYNYTMIFERQLSLSRSSQAVNAVDNENAMDRQAAELTPELLKELEGAFIYSDRNASSDFSDRSAGGFYWQATQLGSSNAQDKGGNTVSFGDLDNVIETYLKNGGDPNQLCALTSVRQQRKLNGLKEARIINGGMGQGEMRLNNFVNGYDFGSSASVEVFFSTDVRNDEMYFYQKDKVKVIPLQGQSWKREKLAKTGDTDDEFIVGEYTFEFRNTRETLFMLYNLDTAV